jgi:hypothetical protein
VENKVELVEILGRVHLYTNETCVELRADYGVLRGSLVKYGTVEHFLNQRGCNEILFGKFDRFLDEVEFKGTLGVVVSCAD